MDAPALYLNDLGQVTPVVPGSDQERQAAMLGWVPASVEQARDYFLTQKHGTTGQAAIAAAESLGSMLTFGASTWVEKAAGVDPEAIAAREKANPLASGGGAALGVILPLLATGGASGAAQAGKGAVSGAARMTAPSILARAGAATEKAVLGVLPEGASVAQRVARRGLAAAAGGALEGAGYEVGQLVHESALGDPNLTAESALARIGMSAATFGALTGGGGVLRQLAGEVGGSAAVRSKLSGWLEDLEARSNLKAAGGIQTDLKKLRQKLGDAGSNKLLQEMGEQGLVDWYTTPGMTFDRASAQMERAGATMGDVLKSADAIAAAEREAVGELGTVIRRARAEILKPLKADPYQKDAAKRLESLLMDIGQKKALVPLEELHALRRQGDAALYGMRGTMDPYATAYKQALHDMRGLYSEAIEAGVQKTGIPLDIWKGANREYQVAATALEFAEKGIERSMGNNIFGLSAVLGGVAGTVAGGPIGGLESTIGTEVVRRFGSGALGRLSRGLRGALEGGEGAAVANRTAEAIARERAEAIGAAMGGTGAVPGGAMVAARATADVEAAAALAVLQKARKGVLSEVDDALKGLLAPAARAAVKATEASLAGAAADAVKARLLASSPDMLLQAMTRQADGLQHHAPSVAQATQMASVRAASFLAAKAPASPPAALGAHSKPSMTELARFARYRDVTLNPLKALEHAKRGTLTPEHVEALRTVYPALHGLIQERALWALMGNGGKTLTPFSRMMLSMLTGYDLTGAMGYNPIAANQATFARADQRGAEDQPMPNPNAGALKGAGRTMTPLQRQNSPAEGV